MNHKFLSTIGATVLIISSAGTPWESAHAVPFSPPPGSGAPSQATGGASRGNLFTPADGNGAPSQATGGASRGSLFRPLNRRAPRSTSGGASRGNFFVPSAQNRTPRQAASGASRLGTYELNPAIVGAGGPAAMMALLPQTYAGTTISERPTILVYLPATSAETLMFSLKDEAGRSIYETTVPVSAEAGVRAIALPATAPALEIGKNYQWFVALKVDGRLSPSTPYVDGWIQRIQPSAELAAALKQGDALKRATALGQDGVWYDCAAIVASLRANQPNNDSLLQQWSELLSSVDLGAIKQAPVLGTIN